MPAMQAIEIAHREDRAGGVIRPGTGVSYDSDHGSGIAQFQGQPIAMKIPRRAAGG
jgi:hypothetical protein